MLKDMIPPFDMFRPENVETALALLQRYGDSGWKLAGGHDSLDWFKDRVKRPSVVIDLEGIAELRGIRATPEGIEVGALTTLSAIEKDPLVRERFPVLADAARAVATPQIRNQATLGGNVCQDTRCWYYRFGLTCYRAGGNTCYADTPKAMNREHCIFGRSRCVAVSPSDTAPALVALDASMVVRNEGGERLIPADQFFMRPTVDVRRMTVLSPTDLLTAVRVPARWAGARFYFEKVADRNAWDFALASIASAMRVEGGRIRDVRMVGGAVQCVPRRFVEVEDFLRGRIPDEETAERAGEIAVSHAEPLNHNGFKIPLVANLVKRAVLSDASGDREG